MIRRGFLCLLGIVVLGLPFITKGKTLWKADRFKSKPAKVYLAKIESYGSILTGKSEVIIVEGIYWIEEENGKYVLYGDVPEPSMFPVREYSILKIEVQK